MTYHDTAWIPITHHILPWYTMIYYDVQDIIVKSPLDNITPCWLYIHSFHVLRLLSHGLKAWYFSWWKERPMAWKTHGYQVDDISFGINSKLESGWLYTLQVYTVSIQILMTRVCIDESDSDHVISGLWYWKSPKYRILSNQQGEYDDLIPVSVFLWLSASHLLVLLPSRGTEAWFWRTWRMWRQPPPPWYCKARRRPGPSDGSKNGPKCWRIKELMGLTQFKPQDIWIHLVDLNGSRTFLSWIKWDFRRWRIQNVGQPGPMSCVSIRNTKVGMLFCILQQEGSQETYIPKKWTQKLFFALFGVPEMPWWDVISNLAIQQKFSDLRVPESFRFLKISGAAQGQKAVDMV